MGESVPVIHFDGGEYSLPDDYAGQEVRVGQQDDLDLGQGDRGDHSGAHAGGPGGRGGDEPLACTRSQRQERGLVWRPLRAVFGGWDPPALGRSAPDHDEVDQVRSVPNA